MALQRVTPPATTPVSLEEAKAHLRIDHDDEDDLIESYIDAATKYRELVVGEAFVNQEWELTLDSFPANGAIQIPLGPLRDVTFVNYDDPDGLETTLDTDDYAIDTVSRDGWVVLASGASWPTILEAINAVRVRFTAGYGTAADVPASIKQAILLDVGDFYENREAKTASNLVVNPAADALTWLHRRMFV